MFDLQAANHSIFMCSETFADVLKQAGAKARLQLYKGKTHTDVFVQVSYLERGIQLRCCHVHVFFVGIR